MRCRLSHANNRRCWGIMSMHTMCRYTQGLTKQQPWIYLTLVCRFTCAPNFSNSFTTSTLPFALEVKRAEFPFYSIQICMYHSLITRPHSQLSMLQCYMQLGGVWGWGYVFQSVISYFILVVNDCSMLQEYPDNINKSTKTSSYQSTQSSCILHNITFHT